MTSSHLDIKSKLFNSFIKKKLKAFKKMLMELKSFLSVFSCKPALNLFLWFYTYEI